MGMKINDVRRGAEYLAKVSGRICRVRVDSIEDRWDSFARGGKGGSRVTFFVTNLRTGRALRFRSAAKLRPLPPSTLPLCRECFAEAGGTMTGRFTLAKDTEPCESCVQNATN